MQEDRIEFNAIIRLLLRRWWVFALGIGLGGVVAWATFTEPPEVYASTTKIFVQGGSAPTDLATTRPILQAVSEREDVSYSAAEISGRVDVSEVRNFIQITFVDADPETAAVVANAVATTLINELSNRNIARIAEFQDSLVEFGSPGGDAILAAQVANLPILSVAESAIPSSSPVSSSDVLATRVILGLLVGFALSAGLVLFWNAVDDTVKSEDDLALSTGLVMLGSVPNYRRPEDDSPVLLNGQSRHHPASEAYYIIRANLDYALPEDRKISSLLITGSGPGEGKSTLAANLAVAIAKEGKSVVLVDADLRKPSQHTIFGIDRESVFGVSDVLNEEASLEDALADTPVETLKVLTAGTSSQETNIVLRGASFARLKEELSQKSDVVVYDAPPVLLVSDPLILGKDVDVSILVSEAGVTKRRSARRGAEALVKMDGGVVAGVLTKLRSGMTGYGYGDYGYHGYYGNGHVDESIVIRGKKIARRVAATATFWKADAPD